MGDVLDVGCSCLLSLVSLSLVLVSRGGSAGPGPEQATRSRLPGGFVLHAPAVRDYQLYQERLYFKCAGALPFCRSNSSRAKSPQSITEPTSPPVCTLTHSSPQIPLSPYPHPPFGKVSWGGMPQTLLF
eukprot:scaffold13851_cov124-Isochrysis_galbana.AAC.6